MSERVIRVQRMEDWFTMWSVLKVGLNRQEAIRKPVS